MKRNRMIRVFALVLLGAAQCAHGVSLDNPYLDTVTNRNLFGLKAPPDPKDLVPQVAPPPLPEVKLAGITTLMGTTRAILRVMRPARPPEPAKEISLFLSPGSAAEDGVQVLDIDVSHGLVKISNAGTPQTLDITKNAPKPSAAPPVAGGVSPPPVPGGIIPPSTPVSHAPSATSVNRPMRNGAANGVVGGGPNQIGDPAAAQAAQYPSLEEQTIIMEVNRIKDKALIDAGELPPYPPTDLTPILDAENQQQQQQQQPPNGRSF